MHLKKALRTVLHQAFLFPKENQVLAAKAGGGVTQSLVGSSGRFPIYQFGIFLVRKN